MYHLPEKCIKVMTFHSRKLTGMPTVFQSGPDDYNDQAVYQDTKMILSNT